MKKTECRQVHQVVQGEGHQIAGNDIHNHTRVEEYSPPNDSPYLRPCKACGWHGVAVNANVCGKCGYNYAQERIIAAMRERERRETLVYGLMFAVAALVGFSAWLSGRTSLSFLDALVASGFSALISYGAWCWLRAWSAVKWKALKRRRKD
ncbi:hypothetical protein GCM10007160_25330 [Litchfieldella qijiaojingensis]|uniref:Uncharacterized protein n=1 Tax=Litchfieldella qijiaojingensis TaxID=980347 RepID=A0ABQ2YVE2_9GAMM|nr:hypothetical protein [Halomonas qijiaojingensis]GGX96641.1 hypothetical protein GCM10007160_25330 [Halomonas qijiaojingensis]